MIGGFEIGSRCSRSHCSSSNDLNFKHSLYSLKMEGIISILLGFLPWIVFESRPPGSTAPSDERRLCAIQPAKGNLKSESQKNRIRAWRDTAALFQLDF